MHPPDREDFVRRLIARLKEEGVSGEIRYVSEEFKIAVDGGASMQFFLQNAYDEFCQAPPPAREDLLLRYARVWTRHSVKDRPSLASTRSQLMPMLRARSFVEQARRATKPTVSIPCEVVAEHLAFLVAQDLPDSMKLVDAGTLKDWNLEESAAREQALQNLAAKSEPKWREVRVGLFLSAWRDNYDCSRMLLMDLIRELEVHGTPVVTIPNRDCLLVTGVDDAENLQVLSVLSAQILQQARPLCALAFLLDGDAWRPFAPPLGHRAYGLFKALEIGYLGDLYARQYDELNEEYRKAGEEVHVARVSSGQFKETGELRTWSVWTSGVTTDLPRTDYISFVHGPRPLKEMVRGDVPWARCMEVLGHRMTPRNVYPPRWRVSGPLAAAEFKALGLEA